MHMICINFQVVFFADNFRKCASLYAVYEEIFKLHIFIHISFGERLISFKRAETKHDKVALPKQEANEALIYISHICIICINFQVTNFIEYFSSVRVFFGG